MDDLSMVGSIVVGMKMGGCKEENKYVFFSISLKGVSATRKG